MKIGAQQFIELVEWWGHPEWMVIGVEAEIGIVGELKAVSQGRRLRSELPVQPATGRERAMAEGTLVAQAAGCGWTVIYSSVGVPLGLAEMREGEKLAAKISRALKTQAVAFSASDTSGAMGYTLYNFGRKIGGAESGVRRDRKGDFFSGLGLVIPACVAVEMRGKVAVVCRGGWERRLGAARFFENARKKEAQGKEAQCSAKDVKRYLLACAGGDLKEVQKWLVAGMNPSITTEREGSRPLVIAAREGNVDLARVLLKAGADPDAQNKITGTPQNATALEAAAAGGCLPVVKELLKFGADVNLAGVSTPLAASLYEGHERVAAELLARGARVDGDSLRRAVRKGSVRLVKKVLAAGGVINPKASKAPTALHAAVERKGAVGLQLTRFLIAAGANLNARTGAALGGMTPLHWAALAKNKKAIELLLEAGADRSVRDSNGRTFDHAVGKG